MTSTIQAEADRLAEYGYAIVRCAGKAPRLTKAGLLDARRGKAPRVGQGENIALVAGSGTVPLVIVDIDERLHQIVAAPFIARELLQQCPSSDDLRQLSGLLNGGSGSLRFEVMQLERGAASGGWRWSGA